MSLDRDTLSQLSRLLKPFATRVANMVVRGVVQLASDDKKLQLLQVGALVGETVDNAEHFQPYGFSSVPLAGAESVMLFPNGDRSHPLVIGTSDRRYRPTGGEPGQVTIYNHVTARLVLLPDGSIEARSESGTATKLPTLVDYEALRIAFNAHVHAVATTGGPTAQTGTAAPIASPVSSPSGTSVFKAE